MSTIPLTISNFSGTYAGLNGAKTIVASKRRCLKAAVCFGMPVLRVAAAPPARAVPLAAYKALAVKIAMEFGGARVLRPMIYPRMDSTEKSNISFWTGMTVATMVANQFMGVPKLIHAGALAKTGPLVRVNPSSRKLADLVGQDAAGNWHVLEAKARQADPSPAQWKTWKTQASTVATIGGVSPATRSVCFTRVARNYRAELVDPPMIREIQSVSINFERFPAAFVGAYYGSLRAFLSESAITTQRGDRTLVIRLAAFDPADLEYIYIGMDAEALKAVNDDAMPIPIHEIDEDDIFLGADGICVLSSSGI